MVADENYRSAMRDEELLIDCFFANIVQDIDALHIVELESICRAMGIAESNGRWHRSAAVLVAVRLLVLCTRDVSEVEDTAVSLILTIHRSGESHFMWRLAYHLASW